MEHPPAPQCSAAHRGDNVRGSVCNGLRLDGERKYQRVREGEPGRKPVQTSGHFVPHLTSPLRLKSIEDLITGLAGRCR